MFKVYNSKQPDGKIAEINKIFADILGCDTADVYDKLDEFLGQILRKKPLREYGMTLDQADEFARLTVENQQRLLGNNYIELSEEEIAGIFRKMY